MADDEFYVAHAVIVQQVRALAELSKRADDVFLSLFKETSATGGKIRQLSDRVSGLQLTANSLSLASTSAGVCSQDIEQITPKPPGTVEAHIETRLFTPQTRTALTNQEYEALSETAVPRRPFHKTASSNTVLTTAPTPAPRKTKTGTATKIMRKPVVAQEEEPIYGNLTPQVVKINVSSSTLRSQKHQQNTVRYPLQENTNCRMTQSMEDRSVMQKSTTPADESIGPMFDFLDTYESDSASGGSFSKRRFSSLRVKKSTATKLSLPQQSSAVFDRPAETVQKSSENDEEGIYANIGKFFKRSMSLRLPKKNEKKTTTAPLEDMYASIPFKSKRVKSSPSRSPSKPPPPLPSTRSTVRDPAPPKPPKPQASVKPRLKSADESTKEVLPSHERDIATLGKDVSHYVSFDMDYPSNINYPPKCTTSSQTPVLQSSPDDHTVRLRTPRLSSSISSIDDSITGDSVFSCDQDGYFTSMHRDSGLWRMRSFEKAIDEILNSGKDLERCDSTSTLGGSSTSGEAELDENDNRLEKTFRQITFFSSELQCIEERAEEISV